MNDFGSILLVDDEPANLHLLAELLQRRGYKTRLMPNGPRALASVEKSIPDLILLDIMMPDMDGYEVCQRLKSQEHTREIPVIFISVLDDVFDKVKAFDCGAVDYITKPYDEVEVYARVKTHMAMHQMVREIQVQNTLLAERNQELDAFARVVAHDLKNPLSSITGYGSMLAAALEEMPDEYLQTCLTGITRNGARMDRIINELLQLSKIRQEDVKSEPIDMARLMDEVLRNLALTIEQHAGEISLPEKWDYARGYAPWIEEIWVNYITNGLKYGGQPPRLQFGSEIIANGMIRFWIQDNGTGLTPEQQAVLFTEFTHLDEVRFSGHGLGLSIVKRITKKLGGEAGVESAGLPGKGCRFYFSLPPDKDES